MGANRTIMMKAVIVILCYVTLGACDPTWYRTQVALESTAIIGLACDGGSTMSYLDHSNWQEINPVLGAHPSNAALWGYLIGVGAALVGVDHLLLDRRWPTWGPRTASMLAGGVSAVEWESVGHNMNIGSSFCGVGKSGPWKTLPNGEAGVRIGS